jgi:DNA-binding MarR family transcriptional regulator
MDASCYTHAMEEWLNEDELRVFRAFNRASLALSALLDDELQQATGLPRTYFDLLWRLRRAPDRTMRMSELAVATDSKPSRITHATTKLEAMGYLRRQPVPGDRRGYVAILTDEGLAAAETAAPVFAASVRAHFLDLLSPAMADHVVELGETILREIAPGRVPDPDQPQRSLS